MLHEITLLQKLAIFNEYFLTHKHPGPVREKRLIFNSEPIDPTQFAEEIHAFEDRFSISTLDHIKYLDTNFPIWHITSRPTNTDAKNILICSGIHGYETASVTAIPKLLETYNAEQFPNINLNIISPINPVGAALKSRYNGEGLDINWDFQKFATKEARVVRDYMSQSRPDFILNLHEGPQTGAFIVSKTKSNEAMTIAEKLQEQGIPMAQKTFLSKKLKTPGYMEFGPMDTLGARMIKLHTLGYYAHTQGIPALTFESPWDDTLEKRVGYQLAFLRNTFAVFQEDKN